MSFLYKFLKIDSRICTGLCKFLKVDLGICTIVVQVFKSRFKNLYKKTVKYYIRLKNFRKMLNILKLYFGCSFTAFANYVGMSYHTLYSLSVSRRTYSLDKLNKLLVLHEALALKTDVYELPEVINLLGIERLKSKAPLERMLKIANKEVYKKKQLLESVQKKRAVILRGLQACTVLLAKKKGKESITINDAKWITLRKVHLENSLQNIPYHEELKLIVALASLEKKRDILQEILL